MVNTKNAATSSKKIVDTKLPEDRLRADEIKDLFKQKEPGMVTVLDKFQVTPMLYLMAAQNLEAIENNLMEDQEYTAQELIGDTHWNEFGPEGQREFELCLKHFAAHPESDLCDSGKGFFTLA